MSVTTIARDPIPADLASVACCLAATPRSLPFAAEVDDNYTGGAQPRPKSSRVLFRSPLTAFEWKLLSSTDTGHFYGSSQATSHRREVGGETGYRLLFLGNRAQPLAAYKVALSS